MASPESSFRPKKGLGDRVKKGMREVGAALGLMAATSGAAFGGENRKYSPDEGGRPAVASTERGTEELSADARIIFDDDKLTKDRYAAAMRAITSSPNNEVQYTVGQKKVRLFLKEGIIHVSVDGGHTQYLSGHTSRPWDALPDFSSAQLAAEAAAPAPAEAVAPAESSVERAPEKPAFVSDTQAIDALFTARFPEAMQMAAVEYLLKDDSVRRVAIAGAPGCSVELVQEGEGDAKTYSYGLLVGEELKKMEGSAPNETISAEVVDGYTQFSPENLKAAFETITAFKRAAVEGVAAEKATVAAGQEKKWNEDFTADSTRNIADPKHVVEFAQNFERSPQERYQALQQHIKQSPKQMAEFSYGVDPDDGRPRKLVIKIDNKTGGQLKFVIQKTLKDTALVDKVQILSEGILTPTTFTQIDFSQIEQ